MNGGGQTFRGLSAALTLSAQTKGKAMSNTREHWTLWVCVNCIMHQANGECGDCHNPDGHEYEPLNKVDYTRSTAGHVDKDGIGYGEGESERDPYSTSACDGCGSTYHGERHAMTEWGE